MKRIQIAVSDQVYRKAKRTLIENGISWQRWGEAQVSRIYTEDMDSFEIPLTEMALDRSQFMTKIQEKLVGLLRESAFVSLAIKNNQTKWIDHKKTEIERLGYELLDIFDLETKGRWDRPRAARQAIEYYRDKLKTFITKAKNQYLNYYKEQPIKDISETDIESILNQVLRSLPS